MAVARAGDKVGALTVPKGGPRPGSGRHTTEWHELHDPPKPAHTTALVVAKAEFDEVELAAVARMKDLITTGSVNRETASYLNALRGILEFWHSRSSQARVVQNRNFTLQVDQLLQMPVPAAKRQVPVEAVEDVIDDIAAKES